MNHRYTESTQPKRLEMTDQVTPQRSVSLRLLIVIASILALGSVPASSGGCEGNGHLTIYLDMPQDPKLVPDLSQAAQLRLTPVGPEGKQKSVYGVWSPSSGSLSIGEITPGPLRYLELVGFAADGHVVTYGRSILDNIPEAQDGEIHMALRRPITYVAGAGYILRVDTSQFDDQQVLPAIQVTDMPQSGVTQAVATTSDGMYLIAGATAPAVQFAAFPTNGDMSANSVTRSVNWSGVTLTDFAVSRDNRWLVVSTIESGGAGAVYRFSLANVIHQGLDPNRSSPLATFTGKPTKIRFTSMPDGSLAAVVLVDPLDVKAEDCGQGPQASKYVLVPLDSTSYQPATLPLNGVVSDMEATRDPPVVYMIYPCNGTNGSPGLVGLDPQTGQVVKPTIDIPGARSVTRISDALVVGLGSTSNQKTFLKFKVQALDGAWNQAADVSVAMPPMDILVKSGQSDTNLYLSVPAQTVIPYVIKGTPAGRRISVLLEAIFRSAALNADGLKIPPLRVEAYFYVTADLSAQKIGSTILTKCDVEPPTTSTNLPLTCVGNRPENVGEFQPTTLAHIYEVP